MKFKLYQDLLKEGWTPNDIAEFEKRRVERDLKCEEHDQQSVLTDDAFPGLNQQVNELSLRQRMPYSTQFQSPRAIRASQAAAGFLNAIKAVTGSPKLAEVDSDVLLQQEEHELHAHLERFIRRRL
jgi:hypothetical protein